MGYDNTVTAEDLLVQSKAQDSDETYYLWAMRFFMEFSRRVDFRVDLVRCSQTSTNTDIIGFQFNETLLLCRMSNQAMSLCLRNST